MKYRLPIRSEISAEYVKNDIRWLEVHAGDGGYYLYLCLDTTSSKWDHHYQYLDDLLADCKKNWNIEDGDWISIV